MPVCPMLATLRHHAVHNSATGRLCSLAFCLSLALLGPAIAVAQDKPDTQPTTVIEGQVFDLMGAGVKDAQIVATRPAGESGTVVELGKATSDGMGDFKLTLPGRLSGKVVVTITRQGYAPVTREVEIDPDDDFPPFIDAELGGSAVVLGVVRDFHANKPVAGADVRVESTFKTWSDKTGTDGSFKIEGLPPGAATVVVAADGFGRERLHIETAEELGHLVVELKPERIVHVQVNDDAGKPIADVSVECIDDDRRDYRSLATDAAGKLTVRGVHYDVALLGVRLTHDDFISSAEFDRQIELGGGKLESSHTLVMKPAGTIVGTITDRDTRLPLNGARVVAGSVPSDRTPRDWSGLDGKYRIRGVPPGEQVVTVHLSGHAPELGQVSVAAGQTTTLNLKLGPAAQVGGVVVDAEGKPIPGVYVAAVRWRDHETLGLQAMTDGNGRFLISNSPLDEFLITVMHREYEALRDQPIKAPRTDYRFEMAVATAGGGDMPEAKVKIGDTVPAFELVTLDGKKITSASLRGRTVLLDFWATWCGPCVGEVPNVKAVHEALAKRDDFVLIGISLDQDEGALRGFIRKHKIAWPQVFGDKGGSQKVADDFGVYGIPATFLINPEGKLQAKDLYGQTMKEQIEKVLQSFEPA